MDFGEVFKRAWQVIWKNKRLVGLSLVPYLATLPVFLVNLIGPETLGQWLSAQDHIWIYFALLLLIIALTVFLTVLAQLYVMRATVLVEVEGSLERGRLFRGNGRHVLRGLGLYILYQLVFGTVITVLMVLGVGIGAVTAGLGFLCLAPFFLLLIPVALGLEAWLNLCLAAALSDGSGIFESFGRGWDLFRARIGPVAIVAMILYIGRTVILSAVAAPYYFVAMMPLFFLSGSPAAGATASSVSNWLVLAYYPILAIAQALVMTFIPAAYVIAYRRLAPRPEAVAVQTTEGA